MPLRSMVLPRQARALVLDRLARGADLLREGVRQPVRAAARGRGQTFGAPDTIHYERKDSSDFFNDALTPFLCGQSFSEMRAFRAT